MHFFHFFRAFRLSFVPFVVQGRKESPQYSRMNQKFGGGWVGGEGETTQQVASFKRKKLSRDALNTTFSTFVGLTEDSQVRDDDVAWAF